MKYLYLFIASVAASTATSQEPIIPSQNQEKNLVPAVSAALTQTRREEPAESEKIDPHTPGVWKFLDYDSLSRSAAIVQVKRLNKNTGQISKAHGTGNVVRVDKTIVHPNNPNLVRGFILTCHHVANISSCVGITIKYQNGTEVQGCIAAEDGVSDLALIRTWVPSHYKPIPLAKEVGKYNDVVRFVGYGQISDPKKPRYVECRIFRMTNHKIVLLEDASPGDSGGMIVNSKGELIGIVSHGSHDFIVIDDSGGKLVTAFGQGPSITPILRILITENFKEISFDSPVIHGTYPQRGGHFFK